MKRNGIEEQYVIDDFTSKDTWRIFRILAEFVEGFEMLAKIPPAVAMFGSARSRLTADQVQYCLMSFTNLLRAQFCTASKDASLQWQPFV